jgi:methyltransferase
MTLSIIVLGLVTIQRLAELALANRNTRALLARGGVETGARHYPLIVALHGLWLLGLWVVAWDRPINPIGLAVFFGLQLLRVWVIVSLGERWTTRIITLPGVRLVRRGPYRFLKHPNYSVVVAEIAVLPLAFGLVGYALIFSAANAALLWVRIREESLALRQSAQSEY